MNRHDTQEQININRLSCLISLPLDDYRRFIVSTFLCLFSVQLAAAAHRVPFVSERYDARVQITCRWNVRTWHNWCGQCIQCSTHTSSQHKLMVRPFDWRHTSAAWEWNILLNYGRFNCVDNLIVTGRVECVRSLHWLESREAIQEFERKPISEIRVHNFFIFDAIACSLFAVSTTSTKVASCIPPEANVLSTIIAARTACTDWQFELAIQQFKCIYAWIAKGNASRQIIRSRNMNEWPGIACQNAINVQLLILTPENRQNWGTKKVWLRST